MAYVVIMTTKICNYTVLKVSSAIRTVSSRDSSSGDCNTRQWILCTTVGN